MRIGGLTHSIYIYSVQLAGLAESESVLQGSSREEQLMICKCAAASNMALSALAAHLHARACSLCAPFAGSHFHQSLSTVVCTAQYLQVEA